MNHPEEFTKMTPNHIVKWVLKERQQSRGRGHESSAGRLAHPPHSTRVVEACSTAAARGAAFVRSHCRPLITKVHSVAACAASVQSPSAALNGYDGASLFHHAAYAASYDWRHFDKTGHGYAGRRIPVGRQENPGMRSSSPVMS